MALGRVNVPGFIKFNTDEIDSKTGNSSNLNTESKSNFISSINEIQGESASLTTNASSAMTAAQSASTAASTAGSTASTAKTNADSAADTAGTANTNANSALTKIGDLSSLETETKSSIVAAVNELLTSGGGGSHSSDPELSFSAVSAEVPGTNQSVGINCAYRGSGVLTATSSAPDVIAVSIQTLGSGAVTVKKIILTRVGYSLDDTTINIALTSDGEHDAASGTITVAATPYVIGATLEDTDWSSIQTVGGMGIGANFFDIGDTKTITLNGTVGTLALSNYQCKVFIIEFNYRGDNGIYFQGFKNVSDNKDIALCDSKYGSDYLSDGTKYFSHSHWGRGTNSESGNYGGWKGCDLRYDILGSTNQAPSGYGAATTTSRTGYDATEAAKTSPVANTLMAALPSDLRAVLAPWIIYTNNYVGGSTSAADVTTSIDYLPLLAEFEIFGARSYANQYEQNSQAQMTYYKNGNSKIKYKHSSTGTAVNWWTRSAGTASSYPKIMFVWTTPQGTCYTETVDKSEGIAPAFRVA